MRNTPSIEESVRHSDIVFNLVGRDYTTKLAPQKYASDRPADFGQEFHL